MVGVNALVGSGVPRSTIMSQKNISFFPYGRGDLGRTPTFSQVDLLLQQDFRLPGNMRVTIGLNAINLFDQKTVTGYQATPYRDGFNVADPTFFGGFDPVGGGGGAELQARCAIRHGQRVPGSEGHPAAGEVLVLNRERGSGIRKSFVISSGSPLEWDQNGFPIPDPDP